MNNAKYTPELVAEAVPLVLALKDAKPNKKAIASAIAEAFINGMQTQERLTAQSGAERESA